MNAPTSAARARSPSRTNDATYTIVMSVRPKDSPKVTALRNDDGPSQEPPSIARIARWKRRSRVADVPAGRPTATDAGFEGRSVC